MDRSQVQARTISDTVCHPNPVCLHHAGFFILLFVMIHIPPLTETTQDPNTTGENSVRECTNALTVWDIVALHDPTEKNPYRADSQEQPSQQVATGQCEQCCFLSSFSDGVFCESRESAFWGQRRNGENGCNKFVFNRFLLD